MPSSVAAVPEAVRPVRTLAVCSGKGGVGKTSVSVNVSVALARAQQRVMLLDADLAMANADLMLGVKTQGNLSHVLTGEKSLEDILCDTPSGVKLVPASSGVSRLANLSPAENAGLIHAFSELQDPLDVLVIDVAAGIADSVVMFTRAAQEVLVVVCDEPASLTDAYALIKVLSQEQRVTRFNVLCNQVPSAVRGEALFKKLQGVCDRFLDVRLTHIGNVPADDYLRRAVQMQRPVVEAFPSSRSARAFREIANRLLKLRPVDQPWGGVEFFLERLVGGGRAMAADREIDRYRSLAAAQRQQQESDLVRQYAPLVKRIAHHLSHRLPSTVEFDDLLQAGTLGLLEAARKYNPAEGASFETFAGIRIRGAMIDEVRPMDWTPRSVHRKSREFSEAVRALEHRLGRTPRDQEVMAELGLDAQRYHDALRDTASTKLVSYEAICPPGEAHQATASDADSPERAAHRQAFRKALAKAIKKLGRRDQHILSMYYDDELNFREIGAVLSVSEARVCQLHAKAMLALRRSLQSWVDENPAELAVLREDDA